jgi:hypothetical protein
MFQNGHKLAILTTGDILEGHYVPKEWELLDI